jgi:putative aminopeptidase FrvX
VHAVTRIIQDLSAIGSPTGYTEAVVEHVARRLEEAGWQPRLTGKGALLISGPDPVLLFSAHLDTLGAMISSLKGGVIRFTQLGGWPLPSFEGEYLSIHTLDGRVHRGTLLADNPAAHVNHTLGTQARTLESMHIRLDAPAGSEEELRALGLSVGDIVVFDPRFERTDTGYVRCRFLDDKAGSACLIHVAEQLPRRDMPVAFYFSIHEEVGHGAAGGLPATVREMVAVDMGVIGATVEGRETGVSICAKDSSGPYDYALRRELTLLARERGIAHVVDVFPYYGSDASAALRGGADLRAALIGPGVSASHGVERTHEDGLVATCRLVQALIETRFGR